MATLADPKPSKYSRKIVHLLQSIGCEEFDPDKASIIREGRLRVDSPVWRDDPLRWHLHQKGVAHLHVHGMDTVTDILRNGAIFSFWYFQGPSTSKYNPKVHTIEMWAEGSQHPG